MHEKSVTHNRILVGLDLTVTGDRALGEALVLAKQLPGCEVHVAHVIVNDSAGHAAKHLDQLSEELRTKLSATRARVAEICASPWIGPSEALPIVFHIRLGDPARVLHQLAVDVDATLIVVGTHARTGVQKMLLGSVADVLARTAHVSVMVARPKDYAGLERSQSIEPVWMVEPPAGLSQRVHLEFRDRNVHISGLV